MTSFEKLVIRLLMVIASLLIAKAPLSGDKAMETLNQINEDYKLAKGGFHEREE